MPLRGGGGPTLNGKCNFKFPFFLETFPYFSSLVNCKLLSAWYFSWSAIRSFPFFSFLNNNLLECIFQDDFFVWPSVSDMFWQMIAVDYKSQEKKWAFTCLDRWVTKTGSVNVETVQEKEKEKLSKRKRKATIQCNDTSNGLLHRHNTLLSLNLIEQGQTRYYLGTLPGLITNWFDNSCC